MIQTKADKQLIETKDNNVQAIENNGDDEYVDNVIYKPAQYVENSPMNSPKQEAFDPRSLY